MMPNWAQFADMITVMNPAMPLMRPLAKMLNIDQPFWQLDQLEPHIQGTWLMPTPEVRPQAAPLPAHGRTSAQFQCTFQSKHHMLHIS
jgi:hypothetical protein